MNAKRKDRRPLILLVTLLSAALIATMWMQPPSAYAAAVAPGQLRGQVLGGGAPIANSTVTLWAASASAPKQLGQTRTGSDGRFALSTAGAPGKDAILYLVAKGGTPAANKASGDNAAIALMTVVGSNPPAMVTINEMTTLASVVTHNQYIDGTAIKGSALALRIAAGNVPNFVDLATGGFGATILDALNSAQTPTMANFGTLSSILGGLRHAGEIRCMRQSLQCCNIPDRYLPKGHAGRGRVHRPLSVASGRQDLRLTRPLLSFPEKRTGQGFAPYAFHALSDLLAQRMGFPAQVHRRWL